MKKAILQAMLVVVAIYSCSFSIAGSDPDYPQYLYDLFNKRMGNTSGCYQLGKAPEKYQECMSQDGWQKVNSDVALDQDCKVLPEGEYRSLCLVAAQMAVDHFHDALIKQNEESLNAAYQVEVRNGPLCFSPHISPNEYRECLASLKTEDAVIADVARMKKVIWNYWATYKNGSISRQDGSRDDYYILPSDVQYSTNDLEQASSEIITSINNEAIKKEEASSEAESAKMDAEVAAHFKAYTAAEKKRQHHCGKDFNSPTIGLSENRLKECSVVAMTAELVGGVKYYRTQTGLDVKVVKGKVVGWAIAQHR